MTNIAVLASLLIAGHGNLALDRILGLRVPRILAIPGLAAVAVITALTLPRQQSATSRPVEGGARTADAPSVRIEGDGELVDRR